MFSWKKNNDRIQKLREKYSRLMRKAYEIAPKNKQKSDYLNREARQILQELRKLELNHLH
ncbi:Lacal_2735 family protein [Mesonia mobilis]|nr:Lacal_2735 family protein [Mesonia mobilis]MBQ0737985.1 Lacal_2735 family protein [Aquimarina celericrescens]|tara:strand:+ start:47 stop:226 length:180 start_codon:yes stop_codon:yes gene_type:complete